MGGMSLEYAICDTNKILREVTLPMDGVMVAKLHSSRSVAIGPLAVGPYSLQ